MHHGCSTSSSPGDPRVRSRRAACQFYQGRRRARHDASRSQLPDQGARGARRRAAVFAQAAPGDADRSRAAAGSGDHRGFHDDRRSLLRGALGRGGIAVCQHHPHLCIQLAGAASRRVPDGASLAGGAPRHLHPIDRLRPRGSAPAAATGRASPSISCSRPTLPPCSVRNLPKASVA
jgi:hypothetical protein